MFYVSNVTNTAPLQPGTPLQGLVYNAFWSLKIPFSRVECDAALTMDQTVAVASKIGTEVVKTLFLCNRQQTQFYLLAMPAFKPFRTSAFSHALGIARVSFASQEMLSCLCGVQPGSTTLLSALFDTGNRVNIVADAEVASRSSFCCTDGCATCFVRFPFADLRDQILPSCGHTLLVANM